MSDASDPPDNEDTRDNGEGGAVSSETSDDEAQETGDSIDPLHSGLTAAGGVGSFCADFRAREEGRQNLNSLHLLVNAKCTARGVISLTAATLAAVNSSRGREVVE